MNPLKDPKEPILSVSSWNRLSAAEKSQVISASTLVRKRNAGKLVNKVTREQIKTKEIILDWVDYNELSQFIDKIHLFYNPSYFEHLAKITNLDIASAAVNSVAEIKTRISLKEMKKKDKPPKVEHVRLKKARNEPVYLVVDSQETKFFLINLSVAQQPLKSTPQVDNYSGQEEQDYFVVENYNFFERPEKVKPLVYIKTLSSSSAAFELERGRYVLRIYIKSEAFHIDITSDTNFEIGNKKEILEFLSVESDLIMARTREISNGLTSLFQSFGSPEFIEKMRMHCRSLYSEELNVKGLTLKKLHSVFLESLVIAIKQHFPDHKVQNEVLRSLRIVYLNPALGIKCQDSSCPVAKKKVTHWDEESYYYGPYESYEEYEAPMRIDYNWHATVLQSFFKMILVKRYKSYHTIDETSKSYMEILNNLLIISNQLDYSNEESLVDAVLRNMIARDQRVDELYNFGNDLINVVSNQEFYGVLTNVQSNQWVVIARLSVNTAESETTPCAINAFTGLQNYNVRVFNNDTQQEVFHVANNVAVAHYKYTPSGYTILAYGWSEEQR